MATTLHSRSLPRATAPLADDAARRRADVWHALGVSAIWLTSLVIVALWVSGGGIESTLAGGPDALTSVSRLTGLVSSNLLLYQVLLMARVPLFEHAFGRDVITRMHRLTGFWSFWLFLAHIVLVVLGYAGTAGITIIQQAFEFVIDYPGMLLATVGTLLLIAVVILSIRRARRKLRYESWHLMHLYSYLGVGLALPHQLWTGADFLASPLATFYWWTIWAAAASCTLIYRVALPLTRSARSRLTVTRVIADGAAGVTVVMTGNRLDRLRTKAGQFFVWRFLDGPGWSRGHPFSISTRPHPDRLTITARIVGDGTRRLTQLKTGTRVLIEGPYGHLTGDQRHGTKLLMIGAGAGVAPLVSLLQEQSYAPGDATLITRDSNPDAALLSAEIQRLIERRGLRHVPLNGPRSRTSSPWLPKEYEQWHGAQLLRYLAPDFGDYDIYLCGPTPWMDSVRADLDLLGVAATRIHSEAFAI